jgi:hypothetical protein
MSPENAPAMETGPTGMGEISRLTGVFFEPSKTFADIAERPRWIVPLLLVIIASLVFVSLISSRIGFDNVVRQQLEQRMATMSQQQREAVEKTMDMQVKIASVAAYVSPLVFLPLGLMAAAGVLLGITNGLMSAGLRFKQVYAALCYASLPTVISTALGCVMLFIKKPEDFNIQNPIGFNPGAYMDPLTTSKFVHSLATSLDVFAIWIILLVAVGLKAAAGKRMSFGGALTAVLLPWGVLVFGKAALSGIFG